MSDKHQSTIQNLTGSNSLALTEINLADLKPYARSFRRHPDKQIAKIARSIESFGWVSPILIRPEEQTDCG
jgi:ParB-like chromosome segregation protein Spo0J|tara:strand:+ start:547 stop:759 length:213 start_codon:yes stop_codon:yes gene_type:complete